MAAPSSKILIVFEKYRYIHSSEYCNVRVLQCLASTHLERLIFQIFYSNYSYWQVQKLSHIYTQRFFLNILIGVVMTSRCKTKYCANDNGNNADQKCWLGGGGGPPPPPGYSLNHISFESLSPHQKKNYHEESYCPLEQNYCWKIYYIKLRLKNIHTLFIKHVDLDKTDISFFSDLISWQNNNFFGI